MTYLIGDEEGAKGRVRSIEVLGGVASGISLTRAGRPWDYFCEYISMLTLRWIILPQYAKLQLSRPWKAHV